MEGRTPFFQQIPLLQVVVWWWWRRAMCWDVVTVKPISCDSHHFYASVRPLALWMMPLSLWTNRLPLGPFFDFSAVCMVLMLHASAFSDVGCEQHPLMAISMLHSSQPLMSGHFINITVNILIPTAIRIIKKRWIMCTCLNFASPSTAKY